MSSNWQQKTGITRGTAAVGHSRVKNNGSQISATDQARSETIEAQTHTAALFQYIRRVLDRPLHDIAVELGTTPQVISALEQGRFDQLQNWPQTKRIVTTYLNLVGIDPRPTLHVLEQTRSAPAVPPTRQPQRAAHPLNGSAPQARKFPPDRTSHTHAQPIDPTRPSGQADTPTHAPSNAAPPVKWRKGRSGMPIPAAGDHDSQKLNGDEAEGPIALSQAINARLSSMVRAFVSGIDHNKIASLRSHVDERKISRQLMMTGAAAGLTIMLILSALSSPSIVRFASANMPAPLGGAVLAAHNFLFAPKSFERDGMRWIEPTDPRSRRTDKLPMVKE